MAEAKATDFVKHTHVGPWQFQYDVTVQVPGEPPEVHGLRHIHINPPQVLSDEEVYEQADKLAAEHNGVVIEITKYVFVKLEIYRPGGK